MPTENNGRKWDPKSLYVIPEFTDERSETVTYASPEKHGALLVFAALLAAAAVLAALSLLFSGAVRFPAAADSAPGGSVLAHAASVPAPPAGMPVVTEIMMDNSGSYAAGNGKFYDWIEVCNPTDHTVNLKGFALSDDPGNPGKFVFPDYSLNGGGFVVVFAAGKKDVSSDMMAPFKLKSTGTLLFSGPDGKRIQQVVYLNIPKNSSYALNMSTLSNWSRTEHFTPGYPNTPEGYESFLAANPPANKDAR